MKKDWEIKKLGELGNIFSGNSINEKEKKSYMDLSKKGLFYVATKDISSDSEIEYKNGVLIPDECLSKFKIAHKDSVLICAEGGSAGKKLAYNSEYDICFVNKLFAFEANNSIFSKFVFYYYQSSDFVKHFKNRLAGLIGGVSLQKFKEIPCPVPPLEEQKRIVKILDEKFAQLESLKANSQTNLQNAKDLLFTELTKTFSNETWSKMTLQEVCTRKITDGTHQTPKYCTKEEGGFPFISSKDVTKEYIDWSNIKYIVPELHEELYKRIAPQKDDVLLAKNGTTGVAAIVEDDRVFDIYVTLAVLRPNQEIINPKYLLAIVNSPLCKKQFDAHLKGSGVPNLHLEEIQKIIIPVPPLNEQKEMINKIESLKEKIYSLQEIYTKQIANCDELKQSYLQKAFEGEL